MGHTKARDTATAHTGIKETAQPWVLTVVHSPDASKVRQTLVLSETLVIGREGDAPLGGISDRRLSRRHASLTPKGEQVELLDNDSHNGMFVDGKKIKNVSTNKRRVIRLGDTLLLLERDDPTSLECSDRATLIGESRVFIEACLKAKSAAASKLPVLLLGETGVGKEVFARAVHDWSERRGRFVDLNMAALPAELAESQLFGHMRGSFTGAYRDEQGAFEVADQGSLFLDEIGELPHFLQSKLLRVLETHEFVPVGATRARQSDVLVIAATNADLHREVEAKTFRRDLFARLAGVVVRIPPLRERLADVPLLLRHFFGERAIELSAGFIEAAMLHGWSMNVRELKTVSARLALLDIPLLERVHFAQIIAEFAPQPAQEEPEAEAASGDARLPRPSREELEEVLRRYRGNVNRTATHYGRAVKQIYRWIEQQDIDLASFREPQSS